MNTKTVSRTAHYRERYDNWTGSHNNLRITRTFKSLGELVWEELKRPWLLFLMDEIAAGEIHGCSSSMQQFWIPTMPKKDQKELIEIWNAKKGNKDVKKYKWQTSSSQEQQQDKQQEASSTTTTNTTSSNNNNNADDADAIPITNGKFPETPLVTTKPSAASIFNTGKPQEQDEDDEDEDD